MTAAAPTPANISESGEVIACTFTTFMLSRNSSLFRVENRSVSYVSAPNDFTSFAPLIVSCRWDESPPVISWALTLVRRSFRPNRTIGQKASGKTTRAISASFQSR